MKKRKEIKDFEYEKRFDLVVRGKHIAYHKPDFYVTEKDGRKTVHETKGYETHYWHVIKKLFEACYPKIEYIVIK